MGHQLELKGLEWIFPKCVRQEFAATQGPFVHLHDIETPIETTPVVEEKSPAVKPVEKIVQPSPEVAKVAKEKEKLKTTSPQRVRINSSGSNTADEPVAVRRCVVAGYKNDARSNKVYCSDNCIDTHVRDSLTAMSKEKTKQAQLQAEPASPSTPVTPTGTSGAAKWKESVEFGQLMSQPTPPLSSKSKAINHNNYF